MRLYLGEGEWGLKYWRGLRKGEGDGGKNKSGGSWAYV